MPVSVPLVDPGLALLERALDDLNAGVREEGRRNDGPRIREYAANFDLAPPLNWCAVAVSTWLREGCHGYFQEPPIPGSAVAQNIMHQLIPLGLWCPKRSITLSAIQPGNLLIWQRPPEPWMGHVAVIEKRMSPILAGTVEGNSGPLGDRVARMQRRLDDRLLLGIGLLRVRDDWDSPAPSKKAKLIAQKFEPICERDPLVA